MIVINEKFKAKIREVAQERYFPRGRDPSPEHRREAVVFESGALTAAEMIFEVYAELIDQEWRVKIEDLNKRLYGLECKQSLTGDAVDKLQHRAFCGELAG